MLINEAAAAERVNAQQIAKEVMAERNAAHDARMRAAVKALAVEDFGDDDNACENLLGGGLPGVASLPMSSLQSASESSILLPTVSGLKAGSHLHGDTPNQRTSVAPPPHTPVQPTVVATVRTAAEQRALAMQESAEKRALASGWSGSPVPS